MIVVLKSIIGRFFCRVKQMSICIVAVFRRMTASHWERFRLSRYREASVTRSEIYGFCRKKIIYFGKKRDNADGFPIKTFKNHVIVIGEMVREARIFAGFLFNIDKNEEAIFRLLCIDFEKQKTYHQLVGQAYMLVGRARKALTHAAMDLKF